MIWIYRAGLLLVAVITACFAVVIFQLVFSLISAFVAVTFASVVH